MKILHQETKNKQIRRKKEWFKLKGREKKNESKKLEYSSN